MAENDKHVERIALVDKLTASPEVRAAKIFKALQDISATLPEAEQFDEWDMICFSSEYLVHISQKFTWLQQMSFPLINYVHNAHYIKGADIGLYEEPKLFDSVGVLTSSKIEQPKIVGLNGESLDTDKKH